MTCVLQGGGAFLHCPKTGGSWVFESLKKSGLVRCGIGQEHSIGHREPWAFTVVRNPVAWWVSVWRHQVDHDWPKHDGAHPLYEMNSIGECGLDQWLRVAVGDFAGFCGVVFSRFASASNYVIATEQMGGQFAALCAARGLDVSIEPAPVNVSRAKANLPPIDLKRFEESDSAAFQIWRNANENNPLNPDPGRP